MMNINTVHDFDAILKQGSYVWPGGYPRFLLMEDGGVLCMNCARAEQNLIREAIIEDDNPQWRATFVDINWEDHDLQCDNCNNTMEAAYD